nr:hypothetical protein [Bacillota bacterium]
MRAIYMAALKLGRTQCKGPPTILGYTGPAAMITLTVIELAWTTGLLFSIGDGRSVDLHSRPVCGSGGMIHSSVCPDTLRKCARIGRRKMIGFCG